jgi:hypothetical protein
MGWHHESKKHLRFFCHLQSYNSSSKAHLAKSLMKEESLRKAQEGQAASLNALEWPFFRVLKECCFHTLLKRLTTASEYLFRLVVLSKCISLNIRPTL